MKTQVVADRPGRGRRKAILRPALALAFLFGAAFCGNAWAGPGGHGHGGHGHFRGHSHVGVWVGAPLWPYGYWPGWYGDPFYGYPYYRPLVVQPPPVYIEQGAEPAVQLWYFCSNPQGYYPYVKTCSTVWRTVLPSTVVR